MQYRRRVELQRKAQQYRRRVELQRKAQKKEDLEAKNSMTTSTTTTLEESEKALAILKQWSQETNVSISRGLVAKPTVSPSRTSTVSYDPVAKPGGLQPQQDADPTAAILKHW